MWTEVLAPAPRGHTSRLDTFWTPEPDDDEDPVMSLWRLETESRQMSRMPTEK